MAIRDAGAYGAAMASNYNRRPLPPEVMVDERTWRVIRRRQTIDDLLALEGMECVRGLLIAFEGLDQSGKQTQAESLRDCSAGGRDCGLLSFPDYTTAIGSEISRALHGERDYPADRCNCSTSRTATNTASAIEAAHGRRRDRVRPLPGVEHRLRRGAGTRPRVAGGDPAFLPARR